MRELVLLGRPAGRREDDDSGYDRDPQSARDDYRERDEERYPASGASIDDADIPF